MEKWKRVIKRIAILIMSAFMLTGMAMHSFAYADEEEETRTENTSEKNSEDEKTSATSSEDGGSGDNDKAAKENTMAVLDEKTSAQSTETGDKEKTTDKGGDSSQAAERADGEKIDRSGSFTTLGSAQVKDDIKDGSSKEFLTIVTKNNQTFYLVIDRSSTTDNVYLLSSVDENDLSEFLDGAAQSTESQEQTPALLLPEISREAEATTATDKKKDTVKEEKKSLPSINGFMIFILLAVLAGLAAGYYFKIYKPGHEDEDDQENEGLEESQGYDEEEVDEG